MARIKYLDSLRGLAIIFMVLNHTGHYLTVQPVIRPVYFFIYLTVTLAAPLFLFIAGYAAFLSYQKNPSFRKFFQRSLLLIGCWFLVNLFFYYDQPLLRGRILLTIGLSSMLVYPLLKKMAQPAWLKGIILVSLAGLAVFPWLKFLLVGIYGPWLKEILVSEFPLYPWFFVLVLGAALAAAISRLTIDRQELALKLLAVVGIVLVLTWLIGSFNFGRPYLFLFSYDQNINDFWLPSFLTWFWVLGWILIFFYLSFKLFSRQVGAILNVLVDLGQQSLIFYFLQFFVIMTIIDQLLSIKTSTFSGYLLINFIIIFILCCLAKSRIFARIMVFGRQRLTGKIS